MAIDFMILPLSRYLAGDFVTPAMRLSWDSGVPYVILGPDGRREFPKDVPFGGPDAARERERIQPILAEDLAQLPASARAQLWDERSSAEPVFHRVDPRGYAALVEWAGAGNDSLADLLPWRQKREQLRATLFLPARFAKPFELSSPFQRLTGSAPAAIELVTSRSWPSELSGAAVTLTEALRDAVRLNLPLVVDS